MPNDMETHALGRSHYGFSATKLSSLGASEYTLVTLAVDESGSVDGFKQDIENCLKEVVLACRKSPRADNLLLRIVAFGNGKLREIHGFKLLSECAPDSYTGSLQCYGMTPLSDAAMNAVEAIAQYGNTLYSNDYTTNGLLVVITDGIDNASTTGPKAVSEAIKKLVTGEEIESLISILVGVNVSDVHVKTFLPDFSQTVGFTQYVELADASAKTLSKLAQFVSKSISSQSNSLGTGKVSQPIQF